VGPTIEEKSGVPKARQFVQQMTLYLRHAVRPKDYYQYMLYRKDMRREAGMFIYHHQIVVLLNTLVEKIAHEDAKILKDKLEFWRFCEENGLQTIPVLCVVDGSSFRWMAPSKDGVLPSISLFSKPADMGQGKGVREWKYVQQQNRYLRENGGESVSPSDLIESLKVQSGKIGHRILVQPKINNHTDLEKVVGETLAVARVITAREPHGEPEYLIASIRLPAGSGATSNFGGGHLGAPIDGESGVVGPARFKPPSEIMHVHEHHPVTGMRIAGFALPQWRKAIELVLAAHTALDNMPFVGWDVAFTETGPLIIEGNHGFGSEVIQLTHESTLGTTRLPVYHQRHIQEIRE